MLDQRQGQIVGNNWMEMKNFTVGKNLILKKVVMNSCWRGDSELFLPGFWGKGYTLFPSQLPLTQPEEEKYWMTDRVVTVFKRRKVALLDFLVYSQRLFVGDIEEKLIFWVKPSKL